MTKTLTNHRYRISKATKVFLGICFFLGVFLTPLKSLYAQSVPTIPFQSTIESMFSTWLATGYYSNTHFNYGGNDFVGIIFRQSGLSLPTPQEITINSGANNEQKIECSEQVRGIYYNNQRGRRIWPLDTGNLSILSGQGGGYELMTIQNGLFTHCTGVSGGYTPGYHEVYGQINHLLGTQTFSLFAGIQYNFTNNIIVSGSTFQPTLTILTGGVHSGFIFDNNGGIASLTMNMPWCQGFEVSPTIITSGDGVTLYCQAQNISTYIFNIGLSGQQSFASHLVQGNVGMLITGQTLVPGDYWASCTMFQAGQCGAQIPFHVSGSITPVPSSGTSCDANFQGEMSFSSYNGSIVYNSLLSPLTYYTNKTGITIRWSANQQNYIHISGSFVSSPISGHYTGTNIYTDMGINDINLLNTNDYNYFSSTYTTTGSTGSCTYTDAPKRVYVDTVAPTTPYISSPISGSALCSSNPITVTWNTGYDYGSQLSHYMYEIYNNNGMVTGLVLTGTISAPATSTTINAALLPLGTQYMRLSAVDNVGNISSYSMTNFTTSQQYCTAGTGIAIVTPTIWLRNVDLNKVYRSDPILVLGLTGPTLISISKGMLFLNNNTGGNGTTGIVTSHDTIYIEMISSNEYDTTVTSELRVAGFTGTFSLTTKANSCSLSATEKLMIENIYEELKDEYNDDISKYSEFLNTFQSMVEDESDLNTSCTLEYLLSLIENDFGSEGIDTSNHITPNCKEYTIGYDTDERAYYAPEMMNRYYFVNRESLIRHLDYYNPGDCHINTYSNNLRTSSNEDPMRHIAPNGKIYNLIGQYGGFSAQQFISPKYFDSLQSISSYIDIRNPAKDIWRHTINASFLPIVYAAPNGKEYRIYSTDRGFMSYKLLKVKYYTTLSELKAYIDKNNPSHR